MPELPEVETTLNGITPFINDVIIDDIIVRNPNLRWPVNLALCQDIIGQRIHRLTRRRPPKRISASICGAT